MLATVSLALSQLSLSHCPNFLSHTVPTFSNFHVLQVQIMNVANRRLGEQHMWDRLRERPVPAGKLNGMRPAGISTRRGFVYVLKLLNKELREVIDAM